MDQAPADTGEAVAADDSAIEGGSIQIPSEYLPPNIKEGDSLRCTTMDESGCSFVLETGETAEEPEWEDDFRKEMSPREPQQEAM